MNNIRVIIFLLALNFFSFQNYAQMQRHPIGHLPIGNDTVGSKIMVEGTVIHVNGFFDSKGNLFSSSIVHLSKVFEGDIKDSVIEIITEGGVIPSGSNKGAIQETMWCLPNGEGLFFLMPNTTEIQSGKGYQSFLLVYYCSMLFYHHSMGYNDPQPITTFHSQLIYDLNKDLYPLIIAATHHTPKVFSLNSFEIEMQKHPPNIDGDTTITFPNGNRMRVFKKDLKN